MRNIQSESLKKCFLNVNFADGKLQLPAPSRNFFNARRRRVCMTRWSALGWDRFTTSQLCLQCSMFSFIVFTHSIATCLSVCCLSVCLSVCLFVCLSISLSVPVYLSAFSLDNSFSLLHHTLLNAVTQFTFLPMYNETVFLCGCFNDVVFFHRIMRRVYICCLSRFYTKTLFISG